MILELYIASTLITEDNNNQLVFLVKKDSESIPFPISKTESRSTALSVVLKEIKRELNIDMDNLELNELTNAIYHGDRIPFYVFNYVKKPLENVESIIQNSDEYEWATYKELSHIFDEWEIEGVPLLFND